MTTANSKIIISYNGGSAGDLFVKSCNKEVLHQLRLKRVVQPATLKDYEHKIRMGLDANLDTELNLLPYKFVNTHLLEEVVDKGHEVYNVIMTDTNVQKKTIYRQMQIQKLRIQIDSNDWYTTIKEFCLNKDFISAAKHWFIKAESLWLDRMAFRLQFTKAKVLNFDQLYSNTFVDSLIEQNWIHEVDILKSNHARWLEENNTFTFDNTINTMAEKLSTMNWTQSTGWVEYNP